jgi:hypothetical protein
MHNPSKRAVDELSITCAVQMAEVEPCLCAVGHPYPFEETIPMAKKLFGKMKKLVRGMSKTDHRIASRSKHRVMMMEEMEERRLYSVTNVDFEVLKSSANCTEASLIQVSLTPTVSSGDSVDSWTYKWEGGGATGVTTTQLNDPQYGFLVGFAPDAGPGANDYPVSDANGGYVHSVNGVDSTGRGYTDLPVHIHAVSYDNTGDYDNGGLDWIRIYDVPPTITATADTDAWIGEQYSIHLTSTDPGTSEDNIARW